MLPYSTRCPGSIIGQFCAPEGAAECGVAVLRAVRCWSGRSWLRWRVSMWRRCASRGLTGLRVGRLVSWQRLFLHYFRCRSMLRQARGARRRCQHGPRCRLQRQWPLWRAASPDWKALLLVRRGVREVMLLPVPFARLSCAASAQRSAPLVVLCTTMRRDNSVSALTWSSTCAGWAAKLRGAPSRRLEWEDGDGPQAVRVSTTRGSVL